MGLRRYIKNWVQSELEQRFSKYDAVWKNPGDAENHVFTRLKAFIPSSTGAEKHPDLVLTGAANFPGQIRRLMAIIGQDTEQQPAMTVQEFNKGADATHLGGLFSKYGSDKQTHGYHQVYARIIADMPESPVSILEVGLGTNNPDIVSTMGVNGKPGASLRAFRDYLPKAQVYGADIDKGILFSEDRIVTEFVDQLRPESFDEMTVRFGRREFDLIIDDGLHSPEANLNTLMFGLESLTGKGVMVIEDIPEDALTVWDIVGALLRANGYQADVVNANKAYMFIVSKN